VAGKLDVVVAERPLFREEGDHESAGLAARSVDGHREQRPETGLRSDAPPFLGQAVVLGQRRCRDHACL